MTRDVAPRLKFHKPSLIMSRFFPALQARAHTRLLGRGIAVVSH